MKKWLVLPVLLVFILSGAVLAGCGGGDKSTSGQSTDQPAQTSKSETLTDVFAKGSKVDGLSYDYTMTASDATVTGKVWLQGKKMKSETTVAGQNVVMYVDGDNNTMIMYYPAEKTAMKITSEQAEEQNTLSDTPLDYTSDIDQTSMKELETVVYDGVKCRVVEVTEKDSKTVAKMWIREDYGIPVRIESTDAQGGKFVMEYKNVKVGSIEASVFELPAGVSVTDMGDMMKQMQQIPGMPTGQ